MDSQTKELINADNKKKRKSQRKVINADNKKKSKNERQETLEDLEEEFDQPDEFEKKWKFYFQESFRDCYQDIKHKLNARSSDNEIGVTIMRWFIDNRNLLPHKQLMHDMIRTYSSFLK